MLTSQNIVYHEVVFAESQILIYPFAVDQVGHPLHHFPSPVWILHVPGHYVDE